MTILSVNAQAPLVVGRYYKVPCIKYKWHRRWGWWPVIGPLHQDKAFLAFPHSHYHMDGRFLTKAQRDYVLIVQERSRGAWLQDDAIVLAEALERWPLNNHDLGAPEQATLKRRKCWRTQLPPYGNAHQPGIQRIAEHFAAHQCRRDENGWICPHQATPLGSIQPVDGVIVCPLHGLRIDAKTGTVRVKAPA